MRMAAQKGVTGDKELVDIIRRAILAGKYKPRERLIEMDLSQRYNVSRTPVREAIKQLETMGLVVCERNKGAMVADIDVKTIREMQIVRASLEGLAARLAVDHMTPDLLASLEAFERNMVQAAQTQDIDAYSFNNEQFHLAIYDACRNEYLQNLISGILKSTVHRRSATWRLDDVQLVMERHHAILEALRNGDREAAQQVAEQHVLDAVLAQDRMSI